MDEETSPHSRASTKNPLSIHTSALNRSRFVDIRMLTSGETPSGERESTCSTLAGIDFGFEGAKDGVSLLQHIFC